MSTQPPAGRQQGTSSTASPGPASAARPGTELAKTRDRHFAEHGQRPVCGELPSTAAPPSAGRSPRGTIKTLEERAMTRNVTLLDLVYAAAEHSRSEAELMATVVYMVNQDHVRLCGNFKGSRFDRSRDRRASCVHVPPAALQGLGLAMSSIERRRERRLSSRPDASAWRVLTRWIVDRAPILAPQMDHPVPAPQPHRSRGHRHA